MGSSLNIVYAFDYNFVVRYFIKISHFREYFQRLTYALRNWFSKTIITISLIKIFFINTIFRFTIE